ncbi:uncharacterized protein LOC113473107, partial [Diaphorina citri]|uniref:Uncharacterized protein LOC113473107 n=1 Tax=Diaphorina citri TaxID=121845 RepID=A0A3Q0JP98_DIACI
MVSRDNRWYVSLNVLGTPIIGLVDTGATYSYMSSQLQNCFKALRLSTYSIPAENVIVANGTVERVNSVTSLPYQLKIKGGLLAVRCLPNLDPNLILGMDFIKSVGLIMDAAKEEWWYESDVVTKYKFERNIPAVPKIACAGVRSLTPEESEQLNQVVEEAKRL